MLPPEHALVLADESSPFSMTGTFQSANAAVAVRDRLGERFVNGDGVGWHEHHHGLWHGVERTFAASYRTYLVSEWLPAIDGVVAKLEAGALVADVGCGHGASTILMAQAFPASRFVGSDYHAESIETARQRAAEAGVADRVTFEVAGASDYAGEGYDLVAFFDSFHDLGDPLGAARRAAAALAPGGTCMLVEPYAGDRVEDNLNPIGRLYYGYSTLVCTPGSLSQPGARRARHPGRRGAAGEVLARRRLRPRPPGGRDAAQPRPRGAAGLDGAPRARRAVGRRARLTHFDVFDERSAARAYCSSSPTNIFPRTVADGLGSHSRQTEAVENAGCQRDPRGFPSHG